MLNKEDIKNAIDSEIAWVKDPRNQENSNITSEQAEWFIKGLNQSKLLIDMVDVECSERSDI